MSQHHVVLLLGSNKGNQKENIETALKLLEESGCIILTKSKFLMTKPVEFVSSNIFCNIATSIAVQFSPIQLLEKLKQIENKMGRIYDSTISGKYEDRIIDIDIVLFDNVIFESRKLQIPHQKHLFQRDFSKILLKNIGKTPKT